MSTNEREWKVGDKAIVNAPQNARHGQRVTIYAVGGCSAWPERTVGVAWYRPEDEMGGISWFLPSELIPDLESELARLREELDLRDPPNMVTWKGDFMDHLRYGSYHATPGLERIIATLREDGFDAQLREGYVERHGGRSEFKTAPNVRISWAPKK